MRDLLGALSLFGVLVGIAYLLASWSDQYVKRTRRVGTMWQYKGEVTKTFEAPASVGPGDRYVGRFAVVQYWDGERYATITGPSADLRVGDPVTITITKRI